MHRWSSDYWPLRSLFLLFAILHFRLFFSFSPLVLLFPICCFHKIPVLMDFLFRKIVSVLINLKGFKRIKIDGYDSDDREREEKEREEWRREAAAELERHDK